MVRRVLTLMYKEVRGLHQAAYVLALFAFGSQLLALVRDRLLAHTFGASLELDLYYAAFKVPDLLFVLFASVLSVYVLIPFVARANKESSEAGSQLLSQIFTVFLVCYSFLAVVLIVFTPTILAWLFPQLSSHEALTLMMRILLLQPLFLGISSLFGVITQLGHRFILYAISPLVYNVGIIVGIVALTPQFGLSGLAYGVVLGAVGHMLIQLPFVMNSPLRFGAQWYVSWSLLRDVLVVSIPRAITLSINQLVLLVYVSLASTLAVGSVSVFQFAYNLQSVPLAIIGVSYSVAAFPILAELFASNKLESFRLHIITALRHIIFWSFPAIALLIVLRAQIVRVVLGSGAFDWSDTRLTAAVLALLALSLAFQAINLLLIRALYAGGYTKAPLISVATGAVVAIIAGIGCLQLLASDSSFATAITSMLRVDNLMGVEVVALGVGYSAGVLLQSVLLLYSVVTMYGVSLAWAPMHLSRACITAVSAGAAAYGTLNFIVDGINEETLIGIFIQGLAGGVVGLAVAALVYALCKTPELTEVVQAFHRRLFKTDVVASQRDLL